METPGNVYRYVDIVGVTGSIPVAPTIKPLTGKDKQAAGESEIISDSGRREKLPPVSGHASFWLARTAGDA